MTTLKEIETEAIYFDEGETKDEMQLIPLIDFELLIRAVMQLGETVQMYMEINNDTVTLPYQVDPDVLELLDETD